MLLGLLLLSGSLIGSYWLFCTPNGKAFLEKMKADHKNRQSQIEREINTLKALPQQGSLSQQQQQKAFQALKNLQRFQKDGKYMLILAQVYQEIRRCSPSLLQQLSPAEGAHDIIFRFLIDSRLSDKEIYSLALHALDAHPSEPKSKKIALDMGRYHHGKSRRDGKVTIYDEQGNCSTPYLLTDYENWLK
jgi:hypothetical protein